MFFELIVQGWYPVLEMYSFLFSLMWAEKTL